MHPPGGHQLWDPGKMLVPLGSGLWLLPKRARSQCGSLMPGKCHALCPAELHGLSYCWIHLGLENVLQHQLSRSVPPPLLSHQTQSEATWEFIKPGCTLETSLGSQLVAQKAPLCKTGTPCVALGTPGHRAGQQSWSCTALLVPSAPSPHSSLLNLGTLTCARAGDEPRESWLSSVPAAGAASALGHP